jgi:hypothetical protein
MTRRGRGKSAKSLELIRAAYQILDEIQPASVRAVCYQLFNRKLISSMEKKHTSRVSKQLTDARESGVIPWDWIVDETRAPECISAWQDLPHYLRTIKRAYRRDSWADQPERIEVWSEKGTVRGTIAPVLDTYGVTFRVLHGFSSATVIHAVAEESVGANPLTILYIGDLDPSGMTMSERDLPDRLDRYGAENVTLERIALVKAQTVMLGAAPSFPATDKQNDKNFRWFVANYGPRCWELDAMSPVDLREVVEYHIRLHIEWEPWDRGALVQAAEQESITDIITNWPRGISGPVAEYPDPEPEP